MEVLEKLYYAPRIESTQTQLIQFFQKGIASTHYGIYSFNQTKGKGQGNNQWEMSPQDGLAISLGFKLSSKSENIDWVTVNKHISTLICTFLQRNCEEPIYIKWPNDLICSEKKLAGLLMQVLPFQEPSDIQNNQSQHHNFDRLFIVGVGININPTENATAQTQHKQISLNEINGYALNDLHTLAQSLADFIFERAWDIPSDEDKVHFYFEQCLWRLSERVNVQINMPEPKNQSAIFKGVDRNGRALLEIEGELHSFQHGDARILY